MQQFARVARFFLFAFVAVTCGVCRAEVIARYTFDGNDYIADPSNTDGANTSLDLLNKAVPVIGVTVSEIKFSPGIDPDVALGFAADHYDGALGFSSDAHTDRNFLTSNQTIYFDFTVQAGRKVNLQSLNFDSLKTRGDNTTGSRVTHTVFVNPAGDPAADGLVGDFDFLISRAHEHTAAGVSGAESTGLSFSTGRWEAGPIDLTSFQGLTGTNTVAIRMYSSEGLDRDFGIDNITLNGQVTAIPEPSGVALMALAGATLLCRRRR